MPLAPTSDLSQAGAGSLLVSRVQGHASNRKIPPPERVLYASLSRAMVIHITFRCDRVQKASSGRGQLTKSEWFAEVAERAICRRHQRPVIRPGGNGERRSRAITSALEPR